MLPTSLVGLALLVYSLTPGLAFLQRRELYHAGRRYSVLRETSIVVVTSLVANLIAIGLFALVSNAIPDSRNATNAFLDGGTEWVRHNYRSSLVVGVAILGTATLLAALAAAPPMWIPGMKSDQGGRWRGNRQQLTSAWTIAFSTNNKTGAPVLVGAELQNGTYVRGILDHWTTDLEDHPSRSLLLTQPLAIRVGSEFVPLDGHYLELSASQVRYMTALYVDSEAVASAQPSDPDAALESDSAPALPTT